MTDERGKQTIQMRVDPEIHTALQVLAKSEHQTMTQYIVALILRAWREYQKKGERE